MPAPTRQPQDAADSYSSAFLTLAIILRRGDRDRRGLSASIWFAISLPAFPRSSSRCRRSAKGDLTAAVPHQGEKTEIGAMADTLQVFKDALIAKRAADEAAARDAEAKIERGHRVDNITREFESMIGEIVETVSSASSRARGLRGHAFDHRRTLAGTGHHGRGGVRRGLDQRTVGCIRH